MARESGAGWALVILREIEIRQRGGLAGAHNGKATADVAILSEKPEDWVEASDEI